MKTYEEVFEETISANKCHSIDPFEVFERMKKSAIEAHNEYTSQLCDSTISKEVKKETTQPEVALPSQVGYSERQLEAMYCIGYLNQKNLSMNLLSEQADELKHKFSLAKNFVQENIPSPSVLPSAKEMARNAFEQSRLTHPMVGFKYDTFEDWLASYKGEGEPNQEELWRNLRNDFFAECTDKKMKQIGTAFVQVPAINMAPHDLFEWFKYKITKL